MTKKSQSECTCLCLFFPSKMLEAEAKKSVVQNDGQTILSVCDHRWSWFEDISNISKLTFDVSENWHWKLMMGRVWENAQKIFTRYFLTEQKFFLFRVMDRFCCLGFDGTKLANQGMDQRWAFRKLFGDLGSWWWRLLVKSNLGWWWSQCKPQGKRTLWSLEYLHWDLHWCWHQIQCRKAVQGYTRWVWRKAFLFQLARLVWRLETQSKWS